VGDARASDVVRLDRAFAYFTDRINRDRSDVFSYLMRAMVDESNADWQGALADCEAAIRLDAKNPWSFELRANIWEANHARRQAVMGRAGRPMGGIRA
jgi:hypothetical protein